MILRDDKYVIISADFEENLGWVTLTLFKKQDSKPPKVFKLTIEELEKVYSMVKQKAIKEDLKADLKAALTEEYGSLTKEVVSLLKSKDLTYNFTVPHLMSLLPGKRIGSLRAVVNRLVHDEKILIIIPGVGRTPTLYKLLPKLFNEAQDGQD